MAWKEQEKKGVEKRLGELLQCITHLDGKVFILGPVQKGGGEGVDKPNLEKKRKSLVFAFK